MIDLLELQKQTHADTKRLGYKLDKESIINKLLEEIEEFRDAKPTPCPFEVRRISNIQNTAEFNKEYDKKLKDREGCELSDIIKICLSYSEEVGTNSEDNLMLKDRRNKTRRRQYVKK